MADAQLTGGVAVRLSALCLSRKGRPSELYICSDVVRAGLLLDLALAGRVEQTADSVVVDSTPTGFGPADRLLAALDAEPERSLDDWLDERRIGLRDLVEGNVATGRWERRRLRFRRDRWTDLHRDQTDRDLARSAGGPVDGWSREDAGVTALAAASGVLDRRTGSPVEPAASVVAAAGDAAWMCQAAAAHLYATAMRYRRQRGALRVADTVGPG